VQSYGTVIITGKNGEKLEVITASFPLKVIYTYKSERKYYQVKETKNNNLVMTK